MGNLKASSPRSAALSWIAFTAALALVTIGLIDLGILGGRADSTAPEAVRSAPASPHARATSQTSPYTAEPVLRRVPTVEHLQYLGDYLIGDSNFTPNDFLPAGCAPTRVGASVSKLTLMEWAPQLPAGFSVDVFGHYVGSSQLVLSNTRMENVVQGLRFVAEASMVPIGGATRDPGLPALPEDEQRRILVDVGKRREKQSRSACGMRQHLDMRPIGLALTHELPAGGGNNNCRTNATRKG